MSAAIFGMPQLRAHLSRRQPSAARLVWVLAVSALAALIAPASVAAQHCEPLRAGSTCDGVLDYAGSVYIPNGQCQDQIEQSTAQVFQGSLTILSAAVSARSVARSPLEAFATLTDPFCV